MAKTVSDIVVSIGADITALTRGTDKANKNLNKFRTNFASNARKMATAATAITAAVAGAAAGILAMAQRAADAGTQIANLSSIAGVSTTEFQKMAAAAGTVGVEQDKLSDILKDVNDKVGDFLETGAGPMADFFDNIAPKVGVTADQFRNLNSADALQLYVSSLEKANLSQSQMTFYMEAIANDATVLIPLLRDGGTQMKRLGDEAQAAGRIMSEEAISGAQELKKELDILKTTIGTEMTKAILDNKDEILTLVTVISEDVIPVVVSLATAFANVVGKIGEAIEVYRQWQGTSQGGVGAVANDADAAADAAWQNSQGREGSTGAYVVDENGNLIDAATGQPVGAVDSAPVQTSVSTSKKTGSSKPRGSGSSGSADSAEERLAALRAEFASERELELERYQEKLDDYAEYAELAQVAESEKNATLEQLAQDHADRMREIDQARQNAALSGFQSMFGDLASLMDSSNKKLFKIGQAAAVAESLVSGYRAAVEAWEYGMGVGGPPVAAAFTAASLAKTGALISQIKSASSSSSGASSASTGSSASTATTENVTRAYFNISGLGAEAAATATTIIEQLNAEIENGGRISSIGIGSA